MLLACRPRLGHACRAIAAVPTRWASTGADGKTRAAYAHFERIQTRWNDMDAFGHVNNIHYYGTFHENCRRVL